MRFISSGIFLQASKILWESCRVSSQIINHSIISPLFYASAVKDLAQVLVCPTNLFFLNKIIFFYYKLIFLNRFDILY
jgi:hypothetical protein